MTNKVNAEWHQAHKMPESPSMQQRIDWHVAHAEACSCRPIPESVLWAIEKRAAEGAEARATSPS